MIFSGFLNAKAVLESCLHLESGRDLNSCLHAADVAGALAERVALTLQLSLQMSDAVDEHLSLQNGVIFFLKVRLQLFLLTG